MRQANKTLGVLVLLGLPLVFLAQDKPDRPPWAQPGGAQQSKPADSTKPQDKSTDSSPRGTIKVNVNLVNVLVSVLDEHNRPAPDLPKEAFQIFEEGVPQEVDVFEPETTLPLDIALMLNSAVSMELEMATERTAASQFIQQVLRPSDRMGIFTMDEGVKEVAPFSNRVKELQEAIRKISTQWGISLNDAVYLGSHVLERQGGEHRKVIVLLTDARDATSYYDFEAARKAAVRAGVLIYTIILRPVKNENGRNTAGEHALQTITETTGGAMFFPESAQELPLIFDRINNELRTQYRLAYYPNPRGPANTYRTIEVKVLPGYTARHRTTYLTGPQ